MLWGSLTGQRRGSPEHPCHAGALGEPSCWDVWGQYSVAVWRAGGGDVSCLFPPSLPKSSLEPQEWQLLNPRSVCADAAGFADTGRCVRWGRCPCCLFLAPISDPKAASGPWAGICCTEDCHVAHGIRDLRYRGSLALFAFPIEKGGRHPTRGRGKGCSDPSLLSASEAEAEVRASSAGLPPSLCPLLLLEKNIYCQWEKDAADRSMPAARTVS